MGRNKMREVIAGKAAIMHVMDAISAAQLAGVVVALGHERGQLIPLLSTYHYFAADVSDYQDGLSRSLRAALAVVPPAWDAAFVCLGDMPLISAGLLRDMSKAAQRDTITIPTFVGKKGNPVLWGQDFFPELQILDGDSGGRQLFARFHEKIRLHPAPDESILLDLDTEADLATLKRHMEGNRGLV
jgi:molybdenum cofactor cytidylyltransferase